MPQDIRIWEIKDKYGLMEITKSKLDLEERIEIWLEKDISIISNDLLVIGRQIETDFGGIIDLLCIDPNGDLVIVELKRDKTPREITAQILDYASWVKDLSNEQVTEIANKYLPNNTLMEDAFKERFDADLPEVINENHKMIIVASEIDSSTERILKYLSDSYGVGINAVTFQYFSDKNDREIVANVFLIDPEQVEYSSEKRVRSKRKPNPTYEEFQQVAEKNNIEELFKSLNDALQKIFDYRSTTKSTVAYIGMINRGRQTIFHVIPGDTESFRIASVEEMNVLSFQVYIERFSHYLGVEIERIEGLFPNEVKEFFPWKSAEKQFIGYFKDINEVETFVSRVLDLNKANRK